jgi:hypothetical protein
MSDADAAVLAAWVRAGGKLVAVDWEQTAMYDEDFVSRPPAPPDTCRCAVLEGLRAKPGVGQIVVLRDELYRYAYQGYHDTADDAVIAAALTPPLTATPQLLTTGVTPLQPHLSFSSDIGRSGVGGGGVGVEYARVGMPHVCTIIRVCHATQLPINLPPPQQQQQ